MALTAIAGPLSNLLLSFFSCLLFLISAKIYSEAARMLPAHGFALTLLYYLTVFLNLFHVLNLSLSIFNLLPITPLDGSRLLYLALPERAYHWFARNERYIYFAVLAWLILGDRFFLLLMRIDTIASSRPLTLVASLFAPTVWISGATEALSGVMIRFWTLIPFLT